MRRKETLLSDTAFLDMTQWKTEWTRNSSWSRSRSRQILKSPDQNWLIFNNFVCELLLE